MFKNLKWYTLLITVLFLFAASTCIASAQVSGDYTYTLSEGNVTITNYTGSATTLEIPTTLDGYPVKAIGEQVFNNIDTLNTVLISDCIETIGHYAFANCDNLTSITIPDNVTMIDYGAFYNCTSLNNIILPKKLKTISSSLFDNCINLTSIVIPDGVTHIYSDAFLGCTQLSEVILPQTLEYIGNEAFRDCSALAELVLPENISYFGFPYGLFENTLVYAHLESTTGNTLCKQSSFTATLIDPDYPDYQVSFKIDSANNISLSLRDYFGPDGVIDIPTEVEGFPITELGTSLYYGRSGLIGTPVIPETVTKIGSSAFNGCTGLTGFIKIPESVTAINSSAFRNCVGFTGTLIIPDNVISIGNNAFKGCTGLSGLDLGASLETIGEASFNECTGLTGVIDFPENLVSIGPQAFYKCTNISGLTFKNALKTIDYDAFSDCASLQSVVLPDGLETLGNYAFYNIDPPFNILMPKSLKTIGYYVVDTGATIYCYESSESDFWAQEINDDNGYWKYDVVYLDNLTSGDFQALSLPESMPLAIGNHKTLPCVTFPQQAFSDIKWTSSDISVVSIENGVATAHKKGNATITAAINGASASVEINTFSAAEYFELSHNEIAVYSKDTAQISVKNLLPSNCDESLTWISSDTDYVTIDQTGRITGKRIGNAYVSATSENGISRQCLVHVCYPVTGIEFAEKQLTLKQGYSQRLTCKVTTQDNILDNLLVSFTSSDPAIASIDESTGIVTALKPGTVTITASTGNISATCVITVRKENILILPSSLKNISEESFMGANMERIILPEGVESIGSLAFAYCPHLHSINLPASITTIAENAFEGCENLVLYCANEFVAALATNTGFECIVDQYAN